MQFELSETKPQFAKLELGVQTPQEDRQLNPALCHLDGLFRLPVLLQQPVPGHRNMLLASSGARHFLPPVHDIVRTFQESYETVRIVPQEGFLEALSISQRYDVSASPPSQRLDISSQEIAPALRELLRLIQQWFSRPNAGILLASEAASSSNSKTLAALPACSTAAIRQMQIYKSSLLNPHKDIFSRAELSSALLQNDHSLRFLLASSLTTDIRSVRVDGEQWRQISLALAPFLHTKLDTSDRSYLFSLPNVSGEEESGGPIKHGASFIQVKRSSVH